MQINIFLKNLTILTALVFAVTAFADVVPGKAAKPINTEHVIWNKVPISFSVPIGKERMITFSEPVSFHNSDLSLTTDKVSIINNAGTLYIKAKKVFNPVRIAVVLKKTGKVILIDLSAVQNADDAPVKVLLASKQTASANNKKIITAPITYAGLMRYALQQLYSPKRLLEKNNAINRTPMYTDKSVDLIYGSKVIAMPLISWRGGDLYVTAVLLKNILNRSVRFDPDDVKGKWLAASFYPTNYITAKGTMHDRTTLFLISDRPFNEALNSMRGYR
jgi:integrating conjugative element protein (TIGR03749 family)